MKQGKPNRPFPGSCCLAKSTTSPWIPWLGATRKMAKALHQARMLDAGPFGENPPSLRRFSTYSGHSAAYYVNFFTQQKRDRILHPAPFFKIVFSRQTSL